MITLDVHQAAHHLRAGEVVAIPTETVYGLAACLFKPKAVAQVFALKQRPLTHPLIVHVAVDYPLDRLVDEVPEAARKLMAHFWPGPLTLVFPTHADKVPPSVTGGQSTVAIRCPAHPVAQALLAEVGEPMVAPSANPFGHLSPTTAMHVQQGFEGRDLLILEGGRCDIGMESTIVSVSGVTCQILRVGAIAEAAIRAVVPVRQAPGHQVRVSGQLKQHYQPRTPLYVFETTEALLAAYAQAEPPVFVCALAEDNCWAKAHPTIVSTPWNHQRLGLGLTSILADYLYVFSHDPAQVMHELYYQLHRIDQTDAKAILVQLPPSGSVWDSVRDRLWRARTA